VIGLVYSGCKDQCCVGHDTLRCEKRGDLESQGRGALD